MTRDEVLRIVREELAVAAPDVAAEADEQLSLRHDLEVDSLAVLEIVARLEYRFTIVVPDEAWPELGSMAAITDFIVGSLVTS